MMAYRKTAVAGATGRVGRHIVDLLESAGHEVVPMSRAAGVDVVTGEGLREALAGAEGIVDAASWPSPDQDEAWRFFTASARNLQEAGERAGVRRIVVASIIGCDRFAAGPTQPLRARPSRSGSKPRPEDKRWERRPCPRPAFVPSATIPTRRNPTGSRRAGRRSIAAFDLSPCFAP
jgi:nucleoside-diphosphate-sugar epimerase